MGKPSEPAAKMAKIRYGPFTVQPMTMVENLPHFAQKLPCNECFVTAMEADLEDEDGKALNIQEGAWLHHMVLYLRGNDRKDLLCGDAPGYTQNWFGERFFASGNERTPVRLNSKGKYGYRLNTGDKTTLLYDIVNNVNATRDMYISMVSAVLLITNPLHHRIKPLTGNARHTNTSPSRTPKTTKKPAWPFST